MSSNDTGQDPVAPPSAERERAIQSLVLSARRKPYPPKNIAFTPSGNGVLCSVTDWDPDSAESSLSSNTEYRIHFVAMLDPTSNDGVQSGFVRSTAKATVPATGGVAETMITDDDAQNGYFFCVGADKRGVISEYTTPRLITGQKPLSDIPGPVQRFAATESGVLRDGTTWSNISYECLAPDPLGSFAAMQIVAKDYPTVGEVTELVVKQYAGVAGGVIQGEFLLPVGRRRGRGTVTVTFGATFATFAAGENCHLNAQPGDYFELLGEQQQIYSINSDTQITFGTPGGAISTWTGQTVVAQAGYDFIADISLHARSLSQDGNGELDLSKMPAAGVVLDGLASPPNPPVMIGAYDPSTKVSTIGNVNRLFLTPLIGTEIDSYNIYKGRGPGQAFGACTLMKTIAADPKNTTASIQIDDTDFNTYDREHNQVFTYYATAVNTRDQQSAPSTAVEIACRLDAPNDNGPQVTAGAGSAENLFFNAQLTGVGTVDNTSAGQDANMGGNPPATGFSRWGHEETAGVTAASFRDSTAVGLLSPGAAKFVGISEKIGAWGNATAGKRRVPIGAYLGLMFKARWVTAAPNGTIAADIRQLDAGGAVLGVGKVVSRLSNDVIDQSATSFIINSTDILTPWVLYWCIFHLDGSLATSDIVARILFQNDTTTSQIVITEPMLWIGTTLVAWTAEMVDINVTYPPPGAGAPAPDEGFRDGDSRGGGIIRIP